MAVDFSPGLPPLLSSPEAKLVAEYVHQELLKTASSFQKAHEAPHAIVAYDGSTTTIGRSTGVDSVTRVSAGVYDVVLTKPLNSVNQAYAALSLLKSGALAINIDETNTTTTSVRVNIFTTTSGAATDGKFLLVLYG